jgi:tRNA U38,U39,U40 pseudouridine synthase TruA
MPHQREGNADRSSRCRIAGASPLPPPSSFALPSSSGDDDYDDYDDDDDAVADPNPDDDTARRRVARRRRWQRYAIKFAFDGTTYRGYQSQPHRDTVQDQIEKRLLGILRREAKIMGWGRTDRGVHAYGAVACLDLCGEEVITLASRIAAAAGKWGNGNEMKGQEEEGEEEEEKGGGGGGGDYDGMTTGRRTAVDDDVNDDDDDDDARSTREKNIVVASATAIDAAARFLHSALREFACDAGVGDDVGISRYGSIVVRSVVPVPSDFDARYSSRWKRYVYYVRSCYYRRPIHATTAISGVDGGGGAGVGCGGRGAGGAIANVDLPFAWSRHSWRVNRYLDRDIMIEAASMIGDTEHNFEWLCVLQRGEVRDTRRRVRLSVEKVTTTTTTTTGGDENDEEPYFLRRNDGRARRMGYDGPTMDVYKIVCTCDFFLYKMMRRIVGALVAVGGGDASLDMLRLCLDEYDDYYHRRCGHDDKDYVRSMNDGTSAAASAKTKEGKGKENKPVVPPKLLHTAPAMGLCLEHIEYDIPI